MTLCNIQQHFLSNFETYYFAVFLLCIYCKITQLDPQLPLMLAQRHYSDLRPQLPLYVPLCFAVKCFIKILSFIQL